MTMKTKRGLAVGGGTVFCAALAVLIATRFAPDDKPITTSDSEPTSTAQVNVQISTIKREETKPIEIPTITPDNSVPDIIPDEKDPEKEAADFIEGGGIEIRQDFPEPEKTENAPPDSAAQTDGNTQTEPPEPPKIEDEEMLTNPDEEPSYKPEQVEITPPENNSNPNINAAMHGQKKDGMIFINGFGWVKDEGGGGEGEYLEDMYENGNKIGYFG